MSRDYSVRTDPSGAFIPELKSTTWLTDSSSNILPVKDHTYILENENAEKIAECTVDTVISASNLAAQESYLAINTILQSIYLNNVYITDRKESKEPTIQVSQLNVVTSAPPNANNNPDIILQFRALNINFEDNGMGGYWSPYGLACYYYPVPESSQTTPFPPIDGLVYTENNSRDWQLVTESKVILLDIGTLKKYNLVSATKTYGALYGCAIDSNNLIYVVDNTNNEIVQITPGPITIADGAMEGTMQTTTDIYAGVFSGLYDPVDITFDQYDNAYVANRGSSSVVKISPVDRTTTVYVSGLPNPPISLTYNLYGDQYLYVTTNKISPSTTPVVYKCNQGGYVEIYGTDASVESPAPYGIVACAGQLDASGNTLNVYGKGSVIVVDVGDLVIDLLGDLTVSTNTPVNDIQDFMTATAAKEQIISVTYNSDKTALYALNSGKSYLLKFNTPTVNASGNAVGGTYTDSLLTLGTCCRSKTIDGVDYIYTVTGNNTLIAFNTTTSAFSSITVTVQNSTANPLELPTSIAFTRTGIPSSPGVKAVAYVTNFANGGSIIQLEFLSFNNVIARTLAFTNQSVSNPVSCTINTMDASNEILYFSNSNTNKIYYAGLGNKTSLTYELNELVTTGDVQLNYPIGLRYDASMNMIYFCNKASDTICGITNNNYVYLLNDTVYNPTTKFGNPTDIEIGNPDASTDVSEWLIIANDNNINDEPSILSCHQYFNRDENYARGDVVRYSNGIAVGLSTRTVFVQDLRFLPSGNQSRQILNLTPDGIVSRRGPSVGGTIEDSDCTCLMVTDPTAGDIEYVLTFTRLRAYLYKVEQLITDPINAQQIVGYIAPGGIQPNYPGRPLSEYVFNAIYTRFAVPTIPANSSSGAGPYTNSIRGFVYVQSDNDIVTTYSPLNAQRGWHITTFEITAVVQGVVFLPMVCGVFIDEPGYITRDASGMVLSSQLPSGEQASKSFMCAYPPYQSGRATEALFISTNKYVYRCELPGENKDPTNLFFKRYFTYPTTSPSTTTRSMGAFDDFQNMYISYSQSSDTYIRVDSSLNVISLPFDDAAYDPYKSSSTLQTKQLIYSNWNGVLLTNRRAGTESPEFGDDFRGILGYRVGFHFSYENEYGTPYADSSVDLSYANNQLIVDTTLGTSLTLQEYITPFDVYSRYITINPEFFYKSGPTDAIFRFVTEEVDPEPTNSYQLYCGDNKIGNIFCNNCTYNKSKFLSGTFPISLAYSTFSKNLYVALQNDTISRVEKDGTVANNYIMDIGVKNIKAILLDASFDMYILCETTDENNQSVGYISYVTLKNNIISVEAEWLVEALLNDPIDMTYMEATGQIYVVSGVTPNKRLVAVTLSQTNGAAPTVQRVGLDFGILYDIQGVTSSPYNGRLTPAYESGLDTSVDVTSRNVVYISNTDALGVHNIIRVDVGVDVNGYVPATFPLTIAGLTYKPYTLRASDDGYVYINNKDNHSITKLDVTGYGTTVTDWAVNGIVKPAYTVFDQYGNLFVANAGTGPRTSRISRIWIHYFPFSSIVLPNGACAGARVYDLTTKNFLPISWNSTGEGTFPIPIPEPIFADTGSSVNDGLGISREQKRIYAYALYFYTFIQLPDKGTGFASPENIKNVMLSNSVYNNTEVNAGWSLYGNYTQGYSVSPYLFPLSPPTISLWLNKESRY